VDRIRILRKVLGLKYKVKGPEQDDIVRYRTSRREERSGKKLKSKDVGTKKIGMVSDPRKMEPIVEEEKEVM
jgi:hypothetical protein